MTDALRTDYMPIEEFKRRAIQSIKRGDHPLPKKILDLHIRFDTDFDVFAHNVAHGLRHETVYRSDGGVFARGFVRATGDLAELHKLYRKVGTIAGSRVRITALFFRRKHSDPTMRWAMSVRFLPRTINVDPEEEDLIRPRPEMMQELEKDAAQKTLDAVSSILDSPAWNPPSQWGKDRVRRMRDWITLAYRVGYPAFLNLWYYDRRAAWWYARWETTASERARMTASTGGRLPFDGSTAGVGGTSQWRHYPFRDMVARCRGRSIDECANMAAEEMRLAESAIFDSISDLNREIQRLAPAASQTDPKILLNPIESMKGATSDATGPVVNAFLKHLKTLLDDPLSLYSPYLRYEQSYMTLWQKY